MSRKLLKQVMQEAVVDAVEIQKKVKADCKHADLVDGIVSPPNKSADITNIAIELFRARFGGYVSTNEGDPE